MKVLIYGAGQLARMLCLAGAPLGIRVWAVDVSTHSVVDPLDKRVLSMSIEEAISEADVLSVEFEHVPEDLLVQAEASGKLRPSSRAIAVGADRVKEKQLLQGCDIPNCEHGIVTHTDQLDALVARLGSKLVLKASRDGYDGYGQWRLSEVDQLSALKTELAGLDLNAVPLVVEKMIPFDRELSILGARDAGGNIVFYPLAENLHHKGQLHLSLAPAPEVNGELEAKAREIFTAIANELDYVGVLAVELFQVGDQLLVNEIAPRVHNSGHWSQQGADTCQFENHLRAICDFPLGATTSLCQSAMVNIIGCDGDFTQLLGIPGCHLHWYGKSLREKRKMGHFNLIADSYGTLAKSLTALSEALPQEQFPCLAAEAKALARQCAQ